MFIKATVSVRLVQLNIFESMTFSWFFLSYDLDSLARPEPPAPTAGGTKLLAQNFIYSPVHKCWPKTSWAGNQGNHQNFDPSLLPKNL